MAFTIPYHFPCGKPLAKYCNLSDHITQAHIKFSYTELLDAQRSLALFSFPLPMVANSNFHRHRLANKNVVTIVALDMEFASKV